MVLRGPADACLVRGRKGSCCARSVSWPSIARRFDSATTAKRCRMAVRGGTQNGHRARDLDPRGHLPLSWRRTIIAPFALERAGRSLRAPGARARGTLRARARPACARRPAARPAASSAAGCSSTASRRCAARHAAPSSWWRSAARGASSAPPVMRGAWASGACGYYGAYATRRRLWWDSLAHAEECASSSGCAGLSSRCWKEAARKPGVDVHPPALSAQTFEA